MLSHQTAPPPPSPQKKSYLDEVSVHRAEVALPQIFDELLLFLRHIFAPVAKKILVESVFSRVVMLKKTKYTVFLEIHHRR